MLKYVVRSIMSYRVWNGVFPLKFKVIYLIFLKHAMLEYALLARFRVSSASIETEERKHGTLFV